MLRAAAVSADGSVLTDAVALACWIWPAPDVALFNGMTSSMVGKW